MAPHPLPPPLPAGPYELRQPHRWSRRPPGPPSDTLEPLPLDQTKLAYDMGKEVRREESEGGVGGRE